MDKKKSNNTGVCVVCGIITVFAIVANIISLCDGSGGLWILLDVLYIALSVMIFYYAILGYKRPHGNLLKYIILLYAGMRLISVYGYAHIGVAWRAVNNAIMLGLICYMAGRLHRVKQNLIIMIIVAILIVIAVVTGFMEGFVTIGTFTTLIIWIDICVAYVLRFREHHLAGLEDAPNK